MLQSLKQVSGADIPPASFSLSSSVEEKGGVRSRSAFEASLKPRIKQKVSKVSGFFFNQRNRVLAKLEELFSSHSSYSARSITALFHPEEETNLLLKKLTPLLRADLEHGFTMIGRELSVSGYELDPEQAASFLAQRETKLKDVNEITFKELNSSLLEGLRNDEGFTELQARVKAIYQDATERRTPTIAERETTSAFNTGRFLGMKAANVEKKGWQTADDEKVRPAHAQAETDYAKGIPIDQPFIVGEEPLMYPGDASGSPGNTINCRCYSFPILDN